MTRREILEKATKCVCGGRETDHGNPEDSFGLIASLWSAWMGVYISRADVAMMMLLLKAARVKTSPGVNDDNFVDLAGYAACAGEMSDADIENDEIIKMMDIKDYNGGKYAAKK